MAWSPLSLSGIAGASTTSNLDIDLSQMSYDELVALKEAVDLAMWTCDKWQSVTVPQGAWEAGKDIPVGRWTITAEPECYVTISLGDTPIATKTDVSIDGGYFDYFIIADENCKYFDQSSSNKSLIVDLTLGCYVVVSDGNAIFTTYTGHAPFSFKR